MFVSSGTRGVANQVLASAIMAVLHGRPDDLESLPVGDVDSGDGPSAVELGQVRTLSRRALLVIGLVAAVAVIAVLLGSLAVRLGHERDDLKARLGKSERRLDDLRSQLRAFSGPAAFRDGRVLSFASGTADVAVAAVFAQASGSRYPTLSVLVEARGVSPGVEYDIMGTDCSGANGYDWAGGVADASGTVRLVAANLKPPPDGYVMQLHAKDSNTYLGGIRVIGTAIEHITADVRNC